MQGEVASKPRIYNVIANFHPLVGGAEKQALMQGRSLRERGYATTVITFRHDWKWASYETIEGVPVFRIAGILLGRRKKLPRIFQKLFYLLAVAIMGWALWQHRKQYDILHVYQLNLLAIAAALVCRITGKAIIISVRSADSNTNSKSRNKLSLVGGSAKATKSRLHVKGRSRIGGDLEALERLGKPFVRFTHLLLKHVQANIVILSSRMRDYLAAYDFADLDIQLIPNGIDITRFIPLEAKISGHSHTQNVVCVSRLSYEKGTDVLLQAWQLVQQHFPQARLIIVGDGPLRIQLEHTAQVLGLENSVEFLGTRSDIPAQFHRGVLAVLPSRSEGMPNAVLEAMACGMPCVATRVSGSEDIIQHAINGLLVEPEDSQGLAEALLTLLHNPELVHDFGIAARATIEQHYSLEHITDMVIELYQRITDRSGQTTEKTQQPEIYHLSS